MQTDEPRAREWYEDVQFTGEHRVLEAILAFLIIAHLAAKLVLALQRPKPTFLCHNGKHSYAANKQGACSWNGGIAASLG